MAYTLFEQEAECRKRETHSIIGMSYQLNLNGELSREILKDFAKYIILYIRDFAESQEGKNYIAKWKRNHPEYGDDEFTGYDYDDEDDESDEDYEEIDYEDDYDDDYDDDYEDDFDDYEDEDDDDCFDCDCCGDDDDEGGLAG